MQTEAPFQYCSAGTRSGKQHLLSLAAGLCFYQLAQSLKFCRNWGFRCASLCPSGGAHGPAAQNALTAATGQRISRAGPAPLSPGLKFSRGMNQPSAFSSPRGGWKGRQERAQQTRTPRRALMHAELCAPRPGSTQRSATSPRSVPVPPPHCPGTLPGRRRGDTPGRERSRTAARAGLGPAEPLGPVGASLPAATAGMLRPGRCGSGRRGERRQLSPSRSRAGRAPDSAHLPCAVPS